MRDPFDFAAPPPRYAVAGNPVAHSKSPRIHQMFGEQCGIALDYGLLQVDPGGFPQAVDQFRANGGCGLNVTVPFKQEAWRLARTLTPRADRARAVNTLKFGADDGVFGDNTDGIGLLRDLTVNLQVALGGCSILVLGSGGASRGILGPLLDARPRRLVIANRTIDRAVELARAFKDLGPVTGCGLGDAGPGRFDLVLNATAATLVGAELALPDTLFRPGALAYDLMYADLATPFMEWAVAHGAARAVDGLGMLVEQAAESFRVWHGVSPDTRPVIAALRT